MSDSARLEKSNPEYRNAISAFIWQDNKLLMLEHATWGFWTVPVGKAEPGEAGEEAMRREMQEELGIVTYNVLPVFDRNLTYNHSTTVRLQGFELTNIKEPIQNLEPEKHKNFGFLALAEILEKPQLSDQLILYLDTKKIAHNQRMEGQ